MCSCIEQNKYSISFESFYVRASESFISQSLFLGQRKKKQEINLKFHFYVRNHNRVIDIGEVECHAPTFHFVLVLPDLPKDHFHCHENTTRETLKKTGGEMSVLCQPFVHASFGQANCSVAPPKCG